MKETNPAPDAAERSVMNRPLFLLGITFFAILILLNVLGTMAAFCLLAWAAVGLLLCGCFKRVRRARVLPPVFLAVAAACLLFSAFWYVSYQPAVALAGERVPFRAQVIGLPEEQYDRTYYLLKTRQIAGETKSVKLRLSCSAPLDLEPYDTVEGTLTVYPLGSGSERSARSYRAEETYLGGYAQGELTVTHAGTLPPYGYILRLRQWLGNVIEELLPSEEGAVLQGLLLGGSSQLSDETVRDFRTIGVSHLFAVSGLHLAVWSMLLQRLLRRAHLSGRASALPAVAFVLFFMALSGFTPSVVRAGVMMLVYFSGFLIGREPDSLNSLGLAALAVTVGNPFAAVSVSLLLSFFATLGILTLGTGISRLFARGTQRMKRKYVRRILCAVAEMAAVTLAAMVFTLPISIMVFGEVSIIAPLSNLLLAFPAELAMLFIGMALLLRGTWLLTFLQYPPALLAGLLAKYLLRTAHALASIPFASLSANADYIPLWLAGTLALFALAFLLSGRKKAVYRLTAIISAAALLCSGVSYRLLERDRTAITVMDVGNGTAILVSRNGRGVLIGCGGDYRAGTKIRSTLLKKQMETLDFCLVPRENETEASALEDVLTAADPQRLLLPEQNARFLDNLERPDTESAGFYAFSLWDGAAYFEAVLDETEACALLTMEQARILFVFFPTSVIPEAWREVDLVVCRQDIPPGVRARCFLISGEGDRALETAARADRLGVQAAATGGKGDLVCQFDTDGTGKVRRER